MATIISNWLTVYGIHWLQLFVPRHFEIVAFRRPLDGHADSVRCKFHHYVQNHPLAVALRDNARAKYIKTILFKQFNKKKFKCALKITLTVCPANSPSCTVTVEDEV